MRSIIAITAVLFAAALLAGCTERDVTVEETPLKILSETVGYGRAARPGDIVTVDYHVLFPGGQELLSDSEFRFQLGCGAVVAGMDEAVAGMKVGGRRMVKCPPHKHWGSMGYGDGKIPPNTYLTFAVKLTAVE